MKRNQPQPNGDKRPKYEVFPGVFIDMPEQMIQQQAQQQHMQRPASQWHPKPYSAYMQDQPNYMPPANPYQSVPVSAATNPHTFSVINNTYIPTQQTKGASLSHSQSPSQPPPPPQYSYKALQQNAGIAHGSYKSYMNNNNDISSDSDSAPEEVSTKLPLPPAKVHSMFTSLPTKSNKKIQLNKGQLSNLPLKSNSAAKSTSNGENQRKNQRKTNPKQQDKEDFSDSDSDFDLDEERTIQGTTIKLDTPEDIEKWIAERKANWPTNKRVQKREEEKEQLKRLIQPNNNTANEKPICRFFQRTGKCKHGAKCKFSHSKNKNPSAVKSMAYHKVKLVHGIPVQIPLRFTPNGSTTLGGKLIDEEIKERNIKLINVIELIGKSDILKPWDELVEHIKRV
ncbi:hypothetical protein DAMA08_041630 [Martiniozyma asiatica (nom. inval.)]|nr:hypothetical protein DAMA08_041630 [Martiniozyma asiatica]